MRVFFATSELAPLAQSGGLGDAVAGLARALAARGHDVVALLPAYRAALAHPSCPPLAEAGAVRLPGPFGDVRGRWLSGRLGPRLELRLLDIPAFFDRPGLYGDAAASYGDEAARFISFSRAVALRAYEERPDVLVAHDWHGALSLCVLRTVYDRGPARGIGAVQVVHNNAYQGRQPAAAMSWTALPGELFAPDGLEFFGDLALLKGGLVWADRIVAVSPGYAREVQTPEFGLGLEGLYQLRRAHLVGIANGLDVDRFDPSTDKALPERFHPGAPLGKRTCRERTLGGARARDARRRAASSSGSAGSARRRAGTCWPPPCPPWSLRARRSRCSAKASARSPTRSAAAARRFPRRVHTTLAWDERAARRLYAAADCVLVPSRFEPCGLVQLHRAALRRAARRAPTGGLVDTIRDGETGVLFAPLTPRRSSAPPRALSKLIEERGHERVVRELLRLDVSWARPAALWEATLEGVVRDARARV